MSLVTYLRTLRRQHSQGKRPTQATKRAAHLGVEDLEKRELMAGDLVAAYSFNEGAGSVLRDVSGNNNHGTIANAAWTNTARYGKALNFDGTSSMVTVADSPTLDLSGGMTVEAWVRPGAVTDGRTVLLKEQPGGAAYALYSAAANNSLGRATAVVNVGPAGLQSTSAAALKKQAWTHLAGTFDGTNLRIYVNGSLKSTTAVSGSIVASAGTLQIGGNGVWGQYFKGQIDELRIYNVSLTQSQIQADMATPITGTPPAPPALTADAGANRSAAEGSAVQFSGSASGGVGGYGYTWNFGDGTTGAGASPAHVYADNGSYTATLTVTDAAGTVRTDTALVTVSNVAPSSLALTRSASSINEGDNFTLSGTFADPGTADSHVLQINWGDGTTSTVNLAAGVTDFSLSHRYADNPAGQPLGSFSVSVSLSDKDGASTSGLTTVQVMNAAPTAQAGGPYSATAGQAINFVGTGGDVSADAALTYRWDFGDGTSSTQQNPSKAYAASGIYAATLTVTDKDGTSTTATAAVTVVSAPVSDLIFLNNLNPPALPAPAGEMVRVSSVSQLQSAVAGLRSGQTILIEAGTYTLSDTLWLPQNVSNVAIRGATGRSADVVIQGGGMGGAVRYGFWADNVQNVTFADFTLRDLSEHGVILNAGVDSPLLHNLRLVDIGDQFIKTNPNGSSGVDFGVVEYCVLEYTTQAPDTYTNGVDVHAGVGWVIRNNVFRNFRTASGLAGPAVLMWSGSRDTVTEGNTFIDNHRDIAYGLLSTRWDDHYGGVIQNNMISRAAGLGGDAPVAVWNSAATRVFHNTIKLNGNYTNAIEYRFTATTGVQILNNLTDAAIVARDGATGTAAGNITNAQSSWFVNAVAGDLHLTASATAAINQVTAPTGVTTDYDGLPRPVGATADVGADEYGSEAPATDAGTDRTGSEGGAVTFSGVATGGEGGLSYLWDFGDGTQASGTLTPSHVFADNGAYSVTLTVTDGLGRSSQDSLTVTLSNVAPTPTHGGPYSGVTGTAVTFTASATDPSSADTTAGFSYSWTFGDGTSTTSANPTHVYATPGTYTVALTVTDKDNGSRTVTTTATVVAPSEPPGNFITTPYDSIPNFGSNPTIVSIANGNWSSPGTWSAGRLPTAGDVVSIAAGTTVTYDALSDAALKSLVIQAGGKLTFRTDISTRVMVQNFLVLENGELQVGTAANPVATGVKAEIVFPNVPLDTVADPGQYGNGLVALGKVTMHGAVKSSFVRLAAEPMMGATTLTLSEAATGWQVGDRLVLPDSKYHEASVTGAGYATEYEEATIAAISADGRTITLAAPLLFNHPGARDGDGVLEFLPHVGNRSRNVVVRSGSAAGTRGHVMFTHRADVDVRYVGFAGLGRTTIDPTNSTTNVAGRHPVHFANLIGPAATPANGYQYTFVGNAVFCPMADHRFKWGVTVNNSHYGLIQDNFIYNWAGAGLITLQGNESFNVIERNFALRGRGEGGRDGSGKPGDEGVAFWFRGPNNYVRDNVAANYVGGQIEAAYGFKFYFVYLGNLRIPNFKGADVSVAGQYTTRDGNSLKLLEVSGNEAYGVESGLTYWWVNTFGAGDPRQGGESVIRDTRVWHQSLYGVYGYESNNLTLDGLVVRGGSTDGTAGLFIGDYYSKDFVLARADVQGVGTGVSRPSAHTGGSTFTIRDSYFRNVTDINIGTLYSSGYRGDWIPARRIEIRNVRFDGLPGRSHTAIAMDYDLRDVVNLTRRDEVFVYDYDGVAGYNFQLYYVEQAAGFILPESTYNSDGTLRRVGSPEAGLTNAQNWATYGVALAGAVAPSDATTEPEIDGLVRRF